MRWFKVCPWRQPCRSCDWQSPIHYHTSSIPEPVCRRQFAFASNRKSSVRIVLKSIDTSGSSHTPSTPLSATGGFHNGIVNLLHCGLFLASNTKSIIETLGVGTRTLCRPTRLVPAAPSRQLSRHWLRSVSWIKMPRGRGAGLMQRIDRALVAGKSVHSGHIATRNAAGFVQHARHRRKAVCRARRIGNDFMAFMYFRIDAVNNRQICLRCRCRNQYALAAVRCLPASSCW